MGAEDESAVTVTTPTGGWVRYTSRMHLSPPPGGRDARWSSFTLRARKRGGVGGAQEFGYSTDGIPTTTIDGADGVAYHAVYTFSRAAGWTVPLEAVTVGSGGAQRHVAYTWVRGVTLGVPFYGEVEPGVLGPFSPDDALLPSAVAVTESGRTYTRSYEYEPARFNHFGQPVAVTDEGDFTRTTVFDYQGFVGAPLVADKPVAATVDGMTTSVTYDDVTGFVTSRTDAGVTTTFEPDEEGNVGTRTVGGVQTTTFAHNWGVVSGAAGPGSTVVLTVNPDGSVASVAQDGYLTQHTYDPAGARSACCRQWATRRR